MAPATPESRHVLLITCDIVGDHMAGPGIRTWELGRALSTALRVTVAVPPFLCPHQPSVHLDFPGSFERCASVARLRELAETADSIVTMGSLMLAYPFLGDQRAPVVFDAYDPFVLSGLPRGPSAPADERMRLHEDRRRAQLAGLMAADLVLCASEKQRDYYLGMLTAVGRVNPDTHARDPRFDRLLRVVPFGLPQESPVHSRPTIKGVTDGIGLNDRVVIWGGGIWDWFDAPTAIRAMALIARRREDVKLLFMGTERPNPLVEKMQAVDEAFRLSDDLGLTNRTVFFNDWTAYDQRHALLVESDLGISLHHDLVETRFAFRTRFLDYLWAGLPVVATAGDTLAGELEGAGIGKLVPPGDAEATASAVLQLLADPDLLERSGSRLDALRNRYRWSTVAEPLLDFCSNPQAAPDRSYARRLALSAGVSRAPLKSRLTRKLRSFLRVTQKHDSS